jgi:hypothetical protein
MTTRPRPSSAFIRSLRHALLADFEAELVLALKYGVLQASGFKRPEIARKLDAGPAAIRDAEQRVKRAAERLDHGD